jgi:peptidoglycan/xylan/chitin deacetylase (PgdA/CDA1 family)
MPRDYQQDTEEQNKGLSRRAFLRGTLALGAAAGAAGLLAACGGDNATGIFIPAPTSTTAAQNLPPTAVPPTNTPAPPIATHVPPTATTLPATATPAISAADATATVTALHQRPNVTVLCYHRIREWDADYNDATKQATVLPKDFDDQMAYIKNQGYQIVLPDDMYRYYTDPTFDIPDKSVMISIDDGYASAWTNGVPVLEKYGLLVAFFPMMVVLDKENFFTSDNLRYLDKKGHAICSHTYDHPNLATLTTDEDFKIQLDVAKKNLETLLGHPVKHFAYPWGGYNALAIQHVRSAGFISAYGLGDPRHNDADLLYTIPRVQVFGGDDLPTFQQKLDHWLK